MALTQDEQVEIYTRMVRIRKFEESLVKEFAANRIPGTVHLYIGQEAVATATCACLRPDDYIISTHRGHGHLIARGARTDRMMAEIFGKATGYCKGKGGSMHIADMDLGILGACGVVGGGITIAGGAAIAAQMKGQGQVVVCFLGDGSTNEGGFHEGVNLASVWNLPVVYVIENNLYAESTRITATAKVTDLADRACAYGIPGVVVDGNDVFAVYEQVGQAVVRARKGQGPSLVECKTYRWRGHFEGDQQTYKPKGELEEWLEKEPILRFRKHLIETEVLTDKDAEAVEAAMADEVEAALKFAQDSPFPDPEETLEDVFA